jgi:hypothetical protein
MSLFYSSRMWMSTRTNRIDGNIFDLVLKTAPASDRLYTDIVSSQSRPLRDSPAGR